MRLLVPSILLAACAPQLQPDTTDLEQLSVGEYHSSRVLVGFEGELPALDHAGHRLKARYLTDSIAVVTVPTGEDVLDVLTDLRRRPGLSFVEADVVRSIAAEDPYLYYQWHLDNIGAPAVWSAGETGAGIIVAVVDTGVAAGGPDGFSNLMSGYDFVDGDSDADDENGHGTHVSGTIAQATDNGIGVAGVAPDAAILPVRVLDADGTGYTSDVVAGILYAVSEGADVINLSLGSTSASTAESIAVAAAADAGVLVVAASGNNGSDTAVNYPAAYDSAVAVAAVDYVGTRTGYSNGGIEVDLAAPGGDSSADLNGDGYGDGVLQETRGSGGWGYYFYQGTSMAAPHVAGAAALLMGAGASAEEAQMLLETTAIDRGEEGPDTEYGYGVIDIKAALAAMEVPDEEEPEEEAPEEEPEEDDDPSEDPEEEPGEDPDDGDTTAPELEFFEMLPRPTHTRFVLAVNEPATLLICMHGAPCKTSAESKRHNLRIETWSPTYSMWLTDAAGNVLEHLEAATREPPPPRSRPDRDH